MQQREYAGKFGLSQSMIKDWEKMSPSKWKRVWVSFAEKEQREDHFDFGSCVNCLCFTPSLFKDMFVVMGQDAKLPSEQIIKIIDHVYQIHVNIEKVKEQTNVIVLGTPGLKDYENEIIEIAKTPDINYGKGSYTKERILKEVIEKGQKYFDKLCEVQGKAIISFEDNVKALDLKEILYTHPSSRPYFVEQEGETLLFEQPIFIPIKEYGHSSFFRDNNISGSILFQKSALDIIRINHIQKTIQDADLKTSYDAHKHNFTRAIKKFKYGTQVSYYNALLEKWRDIHYPGYEILPPINIAIDPVLKKPQIYLYKKEDLQLLRYGGVNKKGELIKGWEESLSEIIWHIENNVWDNCREMEEQGFIGVELF